MSDHRACNCLHAAKLASLHNSAAILEFLADGRILTVNQHFLSLFGCRMEELDSAGLAAFWDLTGTDAQEQAVLWSKLQKGESHLGGYRCRTRQGRPLFVFVSFSPVLDEAGQLVQVIALISDATGIAQGAEPPTVDEADDVMALDEAKTAQSEFLASMSHELRTPLNAIIGFSDLIERQLFGPVGDEKYREYARAIHQSGHTLLEFVDAMLALSKVSAGRMEIHDKIFAADYLIGYCLDLAGKDAASRISVSPAAADDLLIRGDFRLLAQALLNVVSNALKFTPEHGAIAVTTRKTSEASLAIEVSDTGAGMSQDEIQKAFSPYGRIQAKITGSNRGGGFGLSISRSFMELHGGELEIASSVGLGTRVSLLLPGSRIAASFEEAAAL